VSGSQFGPDSEAGGQDAEPLDAFGPGTAVTARAGMETPLQEFQSLPSSSRGLGHQVCSDQVQIMDKAMARYGIAVPDRQLACAAVTSPEGRACLGVMAGGKETVTISRPGALPAVPGQKVPATRDRGLFLA
jgi:hypothetical protein